MKDLVVGARDRLRMLVTAVHAAWRALGNLLAAETGAGAALAPGDLAPDFALPGSDGRIHRLSDSRHREAVVLAWFPKAFTPGCAAECRSLQSHRPALDALGARHFAISTDDPATNRQFAASLGVDYPLLSDVGGVVGRAYGVVGRTGFASRWTFFIAPDGRIRAIDKVVRTGSHGQAVAAQLEELGLAGPGGPRGPTGPRGPVGPVGPAGPD